MSFEHSPKLRRRRAALTHFRSVGLAQARFPISMHPSHFSLRPRNASAQEFDFDRPCVARVADLCGARIFLEFLKGRYAPRK